MSADTTVFDGDYGRIAAFREELKNKGGFVGDALLRSMLPFTNGESNLLTACKAKDYGFTNEPTCGRNRITLEKVLREAIRAEDAVNEQKTVLPQDALQNKIADAFERYIPALAHNAADTLARIAVEIARNAEQRGYPVREGDYDEWADSASPGTDGVYTEDDMRHAYDAGAMVATERERGHVSVRQPEQADSRIEQIKRLAFEDLAGRARDGHSDASATGFLSYEIMRVLEPDFVYPDDFTNV